MNSSTAGAVATAFLSATMLTAAQVVTLPSIPIASASCTAATATGTYTYLSPAPGRRADLVLAVTPSALTDAEVSRRFTRATEIVLIGYARYQQAKAEKGGEV